MRRIVHIDMDAFFASVEQRDHPELRGKPVAVGGSGRRGVVAAASYEARRFGVHSAMPGFKAREACPQLVFVKGRMAVYQEVSQQVRAIFQRYTDLIEPLSLDEAYLDVTENKAGLSLGKEVALAIKEEIKAETQLTASAGVAPNKFLAKIASGWRKPDGITVIHPSRAQGFIDALPVGKFFGVGPATEKRLHALGLRTGEDLRCADEAWLAERLGKHGRWLYQLAQGRDERPVQPHRERKSIGAERTFAEDLRTPEEHIHALDLVVDCLWERAEAKAAFGRTLTLKAKYADFEQVTRSLTTAAPFTDKARLRTTGLRLLQQTQAEQRPLRLLGLAMSNFPEDETEDGLHQLTLPFQEEQEASAEEQLLS